MRFQSCQYFITFFRENLGLTVKGVHQSIARDGGSSSSHSSAHYTLPSIVPPATNLPHKFVHSKMRSVRRSGAEDDTGDTSPKRAEPFSGRNRAEVLGNGVELGGNGASDGGGGGAGDRM